MSKFSSYNEELEISSVNDVGVYATGENLKKYIPSMEDEDLEKFIVIKSKLLYVGTDDKETEIADRLGIGGGSETSDAGATVKEVQAIVDGVVELKEKYTDKVPKDDMDKIDEPEHRSDEEGLIGTRLFSRNSLNMTQGRWNILIEYDNENRETARYESGYYWLKKGEIYKIKGEEIEFKNDYVVNYKEEEFIVLSGRAVNWNEKATLGVTENLALNLDPMSLANGKWEITEEKTDITNVHYYSFKTEISDGAEIDTGIQKVGDVKYDKENKALRFNEDEEENPEGNGGAIRLKKSGLNFEKGLTFEIYMHLDRVHTDVNNQYDVGLLCKGLRNYDVGRFIRFGLFDTRVR